MSDPPLFLQEGDLAPLIDMADAIGCLEEAFGRWPSSDVVNLPRQRAHPSQGVLNLMGAVDGPAGVYGVKSYFATSAGVKFYVSLFSVEDGRLLAILESSLMSQVRTGAASGLATRIMALENSTTLGIIGTGRQALAQAAAVCFVRPIERIQVYGRDTSRQTAFVKRLEDEIGVESFAMPDVQSTVEGADVIVTITSATEPVFSGEWLKQGAHVNAAGANRRGRREIDAETVRRSRLLVTDDRQQARLEAEEFIELADAGELDWSDVLELGEALVDKGRARPAGDLTLFKSLGIAFEDVAYAKHLYIRALLMGMGGSRRLATVATS